MPDAVPNPALFPNVAAHYSIAIDLRAPGVPEAHFPGVTVPASVARAVPKRRMEFLAGRYCAHTALCTLEPSRTFGPVEIGADRAPQWPEGIVGAITHTDGFASAVVARARDIASIGLDTECWIDAETATRIASSIATQDEIDALVRASGLDPARVLTTVFSAKETIFKTLYRFVGRYFDFLDARVTGFDPALGTFHAHLCDDLTSAFRKGTALTGRVLFTEAHVHTGMTLFPGDVP